MARIIKEDMMDEILASGPKQYFFQKEEDGEVTIVFTSSISIAEPGDEDLCGRIWNPPVNDANGNPILNANGKPRQPWAKVEAEANVKGAPVIYSLGGKNSSLFRTWISALKAFEIKNDELPGTKWTCTKNGKWNWNIQYIGKEDISSSSPSIIDNKDLYQIKQTLMELKSKNQSISRGVDKKQLIKTIALLTGKTQEEIDNMWYKLINEKVIAEKDGKVSVL